MDDIEAIKQLEARYFRTLDTKDWDGYRQVFTDDVVMDTTESGGTIVPGADEFVAYLGDVLAGTTTVHQGHTPEIALTSDATATCIWALHDIVIWPDGTRLDGFGHYHETYVKGDGRWRIRTSKLTRLHTRLHRPRGGLMATAVVTGGASGLGRALGGRCGSSGRTGCSTGSRSE